MSDFTSEQYTSLDEAYNELVNYIFDVLETDADFHKKLYKYMIEYGNISGRQVCMMLFSVLYSYFNILNIFCNGLKYI